MKLKSRPIGRALLAVAAGLCLMSSAAAEVRYNLINLDLGLGGYGAAMNSLGHITGVMSSSDGSSSHVFLYTNGTMQNLGTLGLYAEPIGLNNRGDVVGRYNLPSGGSRAFMYSGGTMRDISGVRSNILSSAARDVNNLGQAVVTTTYQGTFNTITESFIYDSGQIAYLPAAGGTPTIVHAINDAGRVTGNSGTDLYLYDNGSAQALMPNGRGLAINEAGQIAGDMLGRAFFYDGDGLLKIIAPGDGNGIGRGLNSHGDVVGRMSLSGNFKYQGFVYTGGQQHTLTSLIDPALGLTVVDAFGISDEGDILARACTGAAVNGTLSGCRSVILDALAPPMAALHSLTSPVPEPHSLALMGLGVGLLACRRRLTHRKREPAR